MTKTTTTIAPPVIEAIAPPSKLANLDDYAMDAGKEVIPSFSVQVTDYQPRDGDTVSLCFSEKTLGELPEALRDQLQATPVESSWDAKEMVWVPGIEVEWVVLGKPVVAFQEKEGEKRYFAKLPADMDLGREAKTVARVFMAMFLNGRIVKTDSGEIALFNLKLNSMATDLIAGGAARGTKGTLVSLNNYVKKLVQARQQSSKQPEGWFTQLYAVRITVEPVLRGSKLDPKKSSMGCLFRAVPPATPVGDADLTMLMALVKSSDFRDLLADPFGVKREAETPIAPPTPEPAAEYGADITYEYTAPAEDW